MTTCTNDYKDGIILCDGPQPSVSGPGLATAKNRRQKRKLLKTETKYIFCEFNDMLLYNANGTSPGLGKRGWIKDMSGLDEPAAIATFDEPPGC